MGPLIGVRLLKEPIAYLLQHNSRRFPRSGYVTVQPLNLCRYSTGKVEKNAVFVDVLRPARKIPTVEKIGQFLVFVTKMHRRK